MGYTHMYTHVTHRHIYICFYGYVCVYTEPLDFLISKNNNIQEYLKGM